MRHPKPLLFTLALAATLLGGCRLSDGEIRTGGRGGSDSPPGAGTPAPTFFSSVLEAAQAEIAGNTGETTTPRDASTIPNREDNPETALPVAVTFPAGT